MGSITTGVGLISGIDTAALIESLLALESRPKIRLEQRVAALQAQQTAMLDINARLLNMMNVAASFRLNQIFKSALATTSDESVLTASAGTSAQPGSYSFTVKRLVSTSQQLSKGFANTNSSPLNLDRLSFEFGKGRLSSNLALEDLNGGNGARRGSIKITDREGKSATVDLSDAITLEEVIDRINQTAGVDVTASIEGDHLLITDDTGDSAVNLKVANASGSFTATDLGIAQDVAASTITGTNINYLSTSTSLALLNDGNGVFIRDFVTDFKIDVNGTEYDIDLGRQDDPILPSTLLADIGDDGIPINGDTDDPELTFVTPGGTEYEVDLTGATTVQDLIDRVATQTSGDFSIAIGTGDDHFEVDYLGAETGLFKTLGAGTLGDDTAEALGILNEDGTTHNNDPGDLPFAGTVIRHAAHTPRATTVGDFLDRINNDATINTLVQAQIAADGVSLEIVSLTGDPVTILAGATDGSPYAAAISTATLEDLGFTAGQSSTTSVGGERVVAALGSVLLDNINGGTGITDPVPSTLTGSTLLSNLFNGTGITTNGNASSPDIRLQDRDGIEYFVEVDGLTTVQDLIDAFDTATGGIITMSINGQALQVDNSSNGGQNFQVEDANGASVATELGILADLPNSGGDTVVGVDTMPVDAQLSITDRDGDLTTIGGLQAYQSLSELIDAIHAQAALDNVDITVSLNDAGNGLKITDSSGGTQNLIITGAGADSLGIATDPAGVAADEVEGTNLQLKYVSVGQSLDALNYGRGIGTGSFTITDGLGQTATVSIDSDATTLYDVIKEINSRGLAVAARINDNGDGIVIEEDAAALNGNTPFVKIKVTSNSGTAAKDLNIIGEAESVLGGAAGGASIDGSYERVVDLNTTDTLEEVVEAINDAGIPVTATIINTGATANPYRISFTSAIAGEQGELIIDTGGVDLGISSVKRGRDAAVFFGDDPATAFLIRSSSNTLKNVVQGVTLDLVAASDEAVTITVDRDTDKMVEKAKELVTTFNDAIQRIDQYDFFDVDTEERGVLLNNPTTSRVRAALLRVAQGTAEGVSTQYQLLRQVGITIGANSSLQFDETKFRDALANDIDAVENLFAAFESTPGGAEEIAEGVTVLNTDETITSRGIAEIFNGLLDELTNSVDGTLTLADRNFNDLIDLTNDRIEVFDQRLASRRVQLERQFAAMEASLAQIQGQGQALASLAGNVALLQRQGGNGLF